MSVFPNKIMPFHNLPLNSHCAIPLGVFGFGTEMPMIFAASRFLRIVFYLITLFASLGVCLELLRPLLFPQLPLTLGPLLPHSGSFQGPAGRSPRPPLVPCPTCAGCLVCPRPRPWVANLMPLVTSVYKPCPFTNSNLVFRVPPLRPQCGKVFFVPKVICLFLSDSVVS